MATLLAYLGPPEHKPVADTHWSSLNLTSSKFEEFMTRYIYQPVFTLGTLSGKCVLKLNYRLIFAQRNVHLIYNLKDFRKRSFSPLAFFHTHCLLYCIGANTLSHSDSQVCILMSKKTQFCIALLVTD